MNETDATTLHDITVSGVHFDLTPSLRAFVLEKAAPLLRHEERIIGIRVVLDCEQKRPGYRWFVASGHLSSYGPEMNASVCNDDCHKAVSLLMTKLDRMLQRRAIFAKAQRNHPHAVEISSFLPKG